jgi:hypothetical protein
MRNFIILFKAQMRKNFQNSISYFYQFFLRNAMAFGIVALLFFFPNYFAGQKEVTVIFCNRTLTLFHFVLSGIMFNNLFSPLFLIVSQRIDEERLYGTLEALFVSPTQFTAYFATLFLERFVMTVLINVPLFLFCFSIMRSQIVSSNYVFLFFSLCCGVVLYAGFALIVVGCSIRFEQGMIFAKLFANSFRFFGDIYVPVVLFPTGLKIVSKFIPVTPLFYNFRLALFVNTTMGQKVFHLAHLAFISVMFYVLGYIFLHFAISAAKKKGTLGRY